MREKWRKREKRDGDKHTHLAWTRDGGWEKRGKQTHRMVSGGEGGGELSQESTHTLICFFLDFL